MPTPMMPTTVAAYATGERRTRAGLFGLAVCEISVDSPERAYWKRANAAEGEWSERQSESVRAEIEAAVPQIVAEATARGTMRR